LKVYFKTQFLWYLFPSYEWAMSVHANFLKNLQTFFLHFFTTFFQTNKLVFNIAWIKRIFNWMLGDFLFYIVNLLNIVQTFDFHWFVNWNQFHNLLLQTWRTVRKRVSWSQRITITWKTLAFNKIANCIWTFLFSVILFILFVNFVSVFVGF